MSKGNKSRDPVNKNMGEFGMDDWEDLVKYFDNEDSIFLTEVERKNKIIKSALEPEVKKKLLAFKTKLNRNTPLHKYEILLAWLEVTVVETVLKREGSTKSKARLLRNSATLEENEGVRGVIAFGSHVAKSSLMGQDPFGDNKELPEGCYKLVPDPNATVLNIDSEVTVRGMGSGGDTDQEESVEASAGGSARAS